MIRSRNRLRVCMVLLALNLAFIWGNSLLPGTVSGWISGQLSRILQQLLRPGQTGPAGGDHLLRKLAHGTEFACLGALLCWLDGMLAFHPIRTPLHALSGVLAAACADETIQLFVAGRGSSLIDVWIDTAGGAVGAAAVLTAALLVRRRRSGKQDTAEDA